jgi:hydroxyethylthiazole kinase-like uncharacterized protein yjeF
MMAVTASEMRALDKLTIETYGIPGVVLMENAGRGAAEIILRHFGNMANRRVGIFAGKGNNGGDGLVVARYLHKRGIPVQIYLLAQKGQISGDAKVNMDTALEMKVPLVEVADEKAFSLYKTDMRHLGIVVDGILGTGLTADVRGFYRDVIEFINGLKEPVVAMDIPSGLDSDNGRPKGVCVKADLTVTFGLPKLGQLIHPGLDMVGRLEVVDIGIPKEALAKAQIQNNVISPDMLRGLIRDRIPDSHKGTYGHLLVISGSVGKTGAAALTCLGALRAGAGLVTLGIPKSLNLAMEAKLTEVMTEPLPETREQTFSLSAFKPIATLTARKGAVAIGPGISTHPETQKLVLKFVKGLAIPMIIDADGVNALAGHIDILKKAKVDIIITPHPGEMARLVGMFTSEIQRDRIGITRAVAREHGIYVVLKGARTIVGDPGGNIYINPTGNPGMATGGVGDVLTGIIGGLMVQGYTALDACLLGVYIHGHAGDLIAKDRGQIGMIATDIVDRLPEVIRDIRTKG